MRPTVRLSAKCRSIPARRWACALDGMNRNARRNRCDLLHRPGDIIREVRLVEHDDRRGAAVGHERKQALDARQVEIAVRRRDDEHDVDIGRQQLRPIFARRFANQSAGSRQHFLDGRRSVAARKPQRDEIADACQIRTLRGCIPQAPRHLGRKLDRIGGDPEVGAVLADDTARYQAIGGARGKVRFAAGRSSPMPQASCVAPRGIFGWRKHR